MSDVPYAQTLEHGTRRKGAKVVHDRLEVFFEPGSQPNGRFFRWRLRAGTNGGELVKSKSYDQRSRAVANARRVTGYDLAPEPDFREPQPGIDGEVSVWLVDPRSRRGFPG